MRCVPAADPHHHLVVGIDAPADAFHDADQDRTVPRELAIEIGELALDEESLQALRGGRSRGEPPPGCPLGRGAVAALMSSRAIGSPQ